MKRAWVFCLLGCGFVSSASAHSIRIACHFVPYTHCFIEAAVGLSGLGNELSASDISIRLKGDGFDLLPGLFDATVSSKAVGEEREMVYLRSRHGVLFVDHRFTDAAVFQKVMTDIKADDPQGTVFIRTQRMPVVVEADVDSGTLSASLLLRGVEVASSTSYMKPLNGCWYDEAECAEVESLGASFTYSDTWE